MDYLRGHNLASAPALFVLSRYLVTAPEPVEEAALRRVLQPRPFAAESDASAGPAERRDVLPASLAVGKDLGLLEGVGRRWSVSAGHRAEVLSTCRAGTQAFSGLVLRLLGRRCLAAIDAEEKPPDLAVGLAWLLRRDPLDPFSSRWGDGAEQAFREAGLRHVVDTIEQWRALIRWARAFGLAHLSAENGGRSALVLDPTTAVRRVLGLLPPRAPADRWLRELRTLVPVIDDPRLLPGPPVDEGPAGTTAVALLKLRSAGLLEMAPMDDSPNAVVLRIGAQTHRIGEIRVVDVAS